MYFTSCRHYCEAVLFMLMLMYPSDDGLWAETCKGYIRINKFNALVTLDGPLTFMLVNKSIYQFKPRL
jgi:hypothetical protein